MTMKKLMIMGALILLSAQFSCRTVLRQKLQADSTAVRSQTSSEKFAREIIREYLPGRIDTIRSINSQVIQVPKIITVQQPVLVRESIRESGEKQESKAEEKTATVEQKVVKKQQISPWIYAGAGAAAVLIPLLMLIVAYKVFKARILASIAKS